MNNIIHIIIWINSFDNNIESGERVNLIKGQKIKTTLMKFTNSPFWEM